MIPWEIIDLNTLVHNYWMKGKLHFAYGKFFHHKTIACYCNWVWSNYGNSFWKHLILHFICKFLLVFFRSISRYWIRLILYSCVTYFRIHFTFSNYSKKHSKPIYTVYKWYNKQFFKNKATLLILILILFLLKSHFSYRRWFISH